MSIPGFPRPTISITLSFITTPGALEIASNAFPPFDAILFSTLYISLSDFNSIRRFLSLTTTSANSIAEGIKFTSTFSRSSCKLISILQSS